MFFSSTRTDAETHTVISIAFVGNRIERLRNRIAQLEVSLADYQQFPAEPSNIVTQLLQLRESERLEMESNLTNESFRSSVKAVTESIVLTCPTNDTTHTT